MSIKCSGNFLVYFITVIIKLKLHYNDDVIIIIMIMIT